MTIRLSDVDAIKLENGKKLIEWLGKYKYFSPKKVNITVNEEDKFRIVIYTNDNSYHIQTTGIYLGCIAKNRRPRPGEDWTRGNDLPDGKFGWEMLIKILGAIIFYEARDVVKPTPNKYLEEVEITAIKDME